MTVSSHLAEIDGLQRVDSVTKNVQDGPHLSIYIFLLLLLRPSETNDGDLGWIKRAFEVSDQQDRTYGQTLTKPVVFYVVKT